MRCFKRYINTFQLQVPVVEAALVVWVAVRGREIHRHCEVHLSAAAYVVQEGGHHLCHTKASFSTARSAVLPTHPVWNRYNSNAFGGGGGVRSSWRSVL